MSRCQAASVLALCLALATCGTIVLSAVDPVLTIHAFATLHPTVHTERSGRSHHGRARMLLGQIYLNVLASGTPRFGGR